MKTKNILKFYFILAAVFFLPMLFLGCSSSKKAEKLHPRDISDMINSGRFTFMAERVNPMRGTSRNLTSVYDVKINKDTVDCYLPYFGRAYQAPMDPSQGGLMFKSLDFSYNITLSNKDEWQVYIDPRDNSQVQQMIFHVFGNGNATLNVQSTHRDPISFYGHIQRNND